ncbi:hypothetical protein EZV62_003972 [Acer yangbiense]|uniref:Thioredoxin domain-containing protein n=1 Tax=Acer yangbiense TaxID=1000413 RepID=A0A5C7II78_9ROSI|nr:hypothetical protein EZV62_003972 [Acer yangbiense]
MAKRDADRHTKAASMLDIKGFPTLLLFVNGSSQPYTGGFSTFCKNLTYVVCHWFNLTLMPYVDFEESQIAVAKRL